MVIVLSGGAGYQHEIQEGIQVSERNKAVVRRLVEQVLNGGQMDVIEELYAPALVAEAKEWIAPFRVSFPDVRMEIIEDWLGFAPTRRRFEAVDEVGIYRFRDGRIMETWGIEDNLGRLEQLGLR